MKASSPPNILFLLTDDQRFDALGLYKHSMVETPNLDRLAENGVLFEQAFASSPICAASRASILTGLTERTHHFNFGTPSLDPALLENSYPALLKKAGYRTGFYGKLDVRISGFSWQKPMPGIFDEFEVLSRSPYIKKLPDGSSRHTDDILTDRAVAFLKSQPKGMPFCLSLSFNSPHAEDGNLIPGRGHYTYPDSSASFYEGKTMPPPALGDQKYFNILPHFLKDSMNRDRYFWGYDTPAKYQLNTQAYFRMITGIDQMVGRILDTLKENGMENNTVVIFCADNGYYMADRGFQGKFTHFDQSLRIPFIIFDPRQSEQNRHRRVHSMVLNLDVPATIVDIAGLSVPATYQGRSLLPLVSENPPSSDDKAKELGTDCRKEFFCEQLMKHPRQRPWYGIRNEKYKYANYFNEKTGGELLYDLQSDPTELTDLATNSKYSEVLNDYRTRAAGYISRYNSGVWADPPLKQ